MKQEDFHISDSVAKDLEQYIIADEYEKHNKQFKEELDFGDYTVKVALSSN